MSKYSKVIQAMVNRGYINPNDFDVNIDGNYATITHKKNKDELEVDITQGIIIMGANIYNWSMWKNFQVDIFGDDDVWMNWKHVWN